MADSLFLSKRYQLAALEYERIFFEAKSDTIKYLACLKKTDCYISVEDYIKAKQTIDRISIAHLPNNLKNLFLFKSALCSYLNSQYNEAELKLFLAKKCVFTDSTEYYKILYLEVINKACLYKFEESKKILKELIGFKKIDCAKKDSLYKIIDLFYSNNNLPKYYDEKTARKWSTFLPGSGQMYDGSTFEGFLNSGLQISALTLAILMFYNEYYITGFTLGLGFFQAFYYGGIRQASKLAIKNSKKKQIIFIQKTNYLAKSILYY